MTNTIKKPTRLIPSERVERFLEAASTVGADYLKGFTDGLNNNQLIAGKQATHTNIKHPAYALDANDFGEGYRDGYGGRAPRGFHGALGNSYGAKGLETNTVVQIRINSEIKEKYESQAKETGVSLSDWAREAFELHHQRNLSD